jgi:hypothetical protein
VIMTADISESLILRENFFPGLRFLEMTFPGNSKRNNIENAFLFAKLRQFKLLETKMIMICVVFFMQRVGLGR